jgi:cephalosporin hydroxylase
MMDADIQFAKEVTENLKKQGQDRELKALSRKWVEMIQPYNYCHSFTWLGQTIIQAPQDIMAMQELIWQIKPDLIIETGIARGGSLVFYSSMLELLGSDGIVLGIDIDIRPHNRSSLETHPMNKRIRMIEGSSISPDTVKKVREIALGRKRIIVCLDSNHTHEHVLRELELYSPFVTAGSYCVVFDTGVEYLPDELCANRPWGRGNNPLTAVKEFLKTNPSFAQDASIENKILITASPGGFLKRIS